MPPGIKKDTAPTVTLLAVTGMSPAILTETIWALAHLEGIIPARIIAVTTTVGRTKLKALWKPLPALGGISPWNALRANLEGAGHQLTNRLRFGETADDIRVITRPAPATGQSLELEDIRTVADNNATAEFILEQVRGIVFNPDTRLIASIAGGRKTMGTLLHASISLLGRERDRITHVLVQEPYDSQPGFWFPGQPDARPRSSRRAANQDALPTIELADIPFIPLRNKLVKHLGREPGSFHTLSAICREDSDSSQPPVLALSESTPGCSINSLSVSLGPREHSLMLFLCERVLAGEPPLADYKNGAEFWSTHRAAIHSRRAKAGADWRASCNAKVDVDSLKHDISSIRYKIKKIGPAGIALGRLMPVRGRFSLDLTPTNIQLSLA